MDNKKILLIITGMITVIILLILFSTIGSVNLSIREIFDALINENSPMVTTIVYKMRLPRNILAALVGANLAVSGLLLQAVMKNPLADPGITGISTGASVAAIIILLLFPQYTSILPIVAFIGGLISCAVVYLMAYKNGLRPERIILAGVAVNAILGGVISYLSTMYSERIQSAMLWLNGSLATKTWLDVNMLIWYSIAGLIGAVFLIRSANVLQLGDDAATNLGFNVNRSRFVISLVAIFLAGVSTSIVGVISFVGLIVPHITRMLLGSDHKYTIPFSIILGSIVLLIADTLARTIGGSIEIPVGVIMSIIGGPFFLYLLRKRGSY
ncbi:FecCD family ABC transporter permease [Clostridioides sp. GD02377]|uniref:FecCD family ABC transporter permease n=1 Tax=unclassified Clostridioides TaxID=2635829 RepID=UPI0038A93B65